MRHFVDSTRFLLPFLLLSQYFLRYNDYFYAQYWICKGSPSIVHIYALPPPPRQSDWTAKHSNLHKFTLTEHLLANRIKSHTIQVASIIEQLNCTIILITKLAFATLQTTLQNSLHFLLANITQFINNPFMINTQYLQSN